ncbi:MAG: LTA synthase family protein [Rhodanobacter sp.]|nr:MAG: LTA synthase family protein [Rhodanobacter sp.]TAM13936.1 MAG: LTA synthase family protein [Rhodanobacter sp.]TAM37778.1 MAG: LTA synthase family protein [Rhodanobacter sp.]
MTPSLATRLRPLLPLTQVLAGALAFVLLTGLVDGGVGVLPWRLLDQARYPLANALPGLLLAGLLLVATRRLLLAFGLAFLLQGVVYAVNALKVANLGVPLLPADFQMVGQLRRGGWHLLAGYLPGSPWPWLALLATSIIAVLAWQHEPALCARRTGGKRLLAGGMLGLALGSLLGGWGGWTRLYNGSVLWLEPWSASATRVQSGLISELLLFRQQYAQKKLRPDRAIAQQLIDQSTPELRTSLLLPTAAVLPDIVVVQSESFFDPRRLHGFEAADLTPNLDRLAARGASGALHVPTFGGGTIRTEFEMLTGLSLRYFDTLQFPYLQMSHQRVPSLVQVLAAHGYATTALHGNDPGFWNRTTAFKTLGFERFVSQAAFPANAPNDGKYMADRALTDEIAQQLKDDGPPQFVFAISIEAHGPYDVDPADTAARDAIEVPAAIVGKDRVELQNYLHHLRHADAELGRLADLLARRTRPTLLLFYGDHLPGLAGSYRTLGFVDGGDMLVQPSHWLLVDVHAQAPATQADTAAWLLPGKLLATAGIHDDPYFALTTLVGPELAALTRAPGSPDRPGARTGAMLRNLDQPMASIQQLRLAHKLDPLLAHVREGSPNERLAHSLDATPAPLPQAQLMR